MSIDEEVTKWDRNYAEDAEEILSDAALEHLWHSWIIEDKFRRGTKYGQALIAELDQPRREVLKVSMKLRGLI